MVQYQMSMVQNLYDISKYIKSKNFDRTLYKIYTLYRTQFKIVSAFIGQQQWQETLERVWSQIMDTLPRNPW